MATADQILALVRSFVADEDERFLAVAMQVAAHEARQGHRDVARQLKDLIDRAKVRPAATGHARRPVPIVQPKGDLASLLSASYPDEQISDLVLAEDNVERLRRVVLEQRQRDKLGAHGLVARHKLLLVGPPGTGKTMTARALAGELHLPLFVVRLDGLITKFMGETAAKLRMVFDAIADTRGVYLFDEFDALGAQRAAENDVGEIRRVLNSFLQFLEADATDSLVVAATNHPEILDSALFRRFDDVIRYDLPGQEVTRRVIENRLAAFETEAFNWVKILDAAEGLSQAEITRACLEAAKIAILSDSVQLTTDNLMDAIRERRQSQRG